MVPYLGGWTSIYQLFWCSPGVQGFDPKPYNIELVLHCAAVLIKVNTSPFATFLVIYLYTGIWPNQQDSTWILVHGRHMSILFQSDIQIIQPDSNGYPGVYDKWNNKKAPSLEVPDIATLQGVNQ